MNKKPYAIGLLALLLCLALCLAACAAEQPPAEGTASAGQTPAEGQDAEEPAAAAPKVILVVSFGTSYNDSRDNTIGAIETAIQDAYPDYQVRRAFTSQIIIDKLAERDGLVIDNVAQAVERLIADGVKELVVQPTHVMNGYEYTDMMAEIAPYEGRFDSVKYGLPLLSADQDYADLAAALVAETQDYDGEGTAIVYMGHGTEADSNSVYTKMQQALIDAGQDNYFIGTVEAKPDLADVLAAVGENGAGKVVLLPLMIVAGDHANNDMAGDEEDSWKTAFKKEGYEVEPVIKGLGEYSLVRQMFVEHVAQAVAGN